jgi:hypothetical protein
VRNRHTWITGAVLAMLLSLPGCASAPKAVAECPRFVPSPEALAPIQGTGWKPLAERVIETYSRPSSER